MTSLWMLGLLPLILVRLLRTPPSKQRTSGCSSWPSFQCDRAARMPVEWGMQVKWLLELLKEEMGGEIAFVVGEWE